MHYSLTRRDFISPGSLGCEMSSWVEQSKDGSISNVQSLAIDTFIKKIGSVYLVFVDQPHPT